MTAYLRRMRHHLNPAKWPLAVRVPMLVAGLMLSVSIVMTDRVLSRLAETQSRHLMQLSDAYLDGLSSALLPHVQEASRVRAPLVLIYVMQRLCRVVHPVPVEP